jgi:hypothetical protein
MSKHSKPSEEREQERRRVVARRVHDRHGLRWRNVVARHEVRPLLKHEQLLQHLASGGPDEARARRDG